MKNRWSYYSPTPEDTLKIGKIIGKDIIAGNVIALIGDLGTGKTWLTKGIANGLEVPKDYYITSPSFTVINEYPGRIPLYHIDLYRFSKEADFNNLGIEEYIFSQGTAIIEWAERLPKEFLPEEHLKIYLRYYKAGRKLIFEPYGKHFISCVKKWKGKATGYKIQDA